jgi:hypothetical protein
MSPAKIGSANRVELHLSAKLTSPEQRTEVTPSDSATPEQGLPYEWLVETDLKTRQA